MKLKQIIKLASVSAIYVVLTIINPFSYGEIQFRIAEVLVLLCFYRKEYIYSLTIGCFIANLFSPIAFLDIIFGVIHTFLSTFLISKERSLLRACLYPIILMPIIAFELVLISNFTIPFFITCLTVMAGEAAVLIIAAYPLFKILGKNTSFLNLIEANQNRRDYEI